MVRCLDDLLHPLAAGKEMVQIIYNVSPNYVVQGRTATQIMAILWGRS